MSTGRFAKSASAQYSDLFIRRPEPLIDREGAASRTIGLRQLRIFLQILLREAALAWQWIESKRTQQNSLRRLRVAETISLGEKRFVSILEVNGVQYLIGGGANHITLLTTLDGHASGEEKTSQKQPAGCDA